MPTINEKNLSIWIEANGRNKPNKKSLQMARSLKCEPEFLGSNKWQTPSTSREGVVYLQKIYFNGFEKSYSHRMKLNIECDCPANKECIHALKLQRVYCANWSYLFILFGMEDSKRFGELWSRAKAVFELMKREEEINQSPGIVTKSCGCHYDRNYKFISEYCVKYWKEYQKQMPEEYERKYQQAIYEDSIREAA